MIILSIVYQNMLDIEYSAFGPFYCTKSHPKLFMTNICFRVDKLHKVSETSTHT